MYIQIIDSFNLFFILINFIVFLLLKYWYLLSVFCMITLWKTLTDTGSDAILLSGCDSVWVNCKLSFMESRLNFWPKL